VSEFNLAVIAGDREQFVIDGQHIRERKGPTCLPATPLRDRWGVLDDDPPPGVSAEQWEAMQAEAAEAFNRLGHDPGQGAGSDEGQ
jgi:hypothetical protein